MVVASRAKRALVPGIGGLIAVAAALSVISGWPDWIAVGRATRPHLPEVALLIIAVVLLAITVRRLIVPPKEKSPDTLNLSGWTVAACGAIVIAVGWLTTSWLLTQANQAKDPAAARIEAIKTGLSIGAGTGGLFALLLAVRRQWHQEITAADTNHDATEKRITELYNNAVNQLGHENAAVRLAALYALERLAQANQSHRQTVVDVICAYLRMPVNETEDKQDKNSASTKENPSEKVRIQQESEVRNTAQRLLCKHLKWPHWNKIAPVDFWSNIDIDLTGAKLSHFNFENCRARQALFNSTVFTRGAFFVRATFEGEPWGRKGPSGTGGVRFIGAEFEEGAIFEDTMFLGDATFSSASFNKEAYFGGVHFYGKSDFDEARFDQYCLFEGSEFHDTASFKGTHFRGLVSFQPEGIYAESARFRDEIFTDFSGATFDSGALFGGVIFDAEDSERNNSVNGVFFGGAKISKIKDPNLRRWPDGWKESRNDHDPYGTLIPTDADRASELKKQKNFAWRHAQ
ncbi:pentapeptide repeat-containing protein [Lentzea sp. NPDC058450]|uniref:pentapeptide repeat-containing protein n=1 Tax=Lentzea sp. NPDC058450 TaxID=3346505 RepID=UPI003669F88B